MHCGLLGAKLGHSYSPVIHKMLADYPYALYEISADSLSDFLQNSDFTGLNVTIPYKKSVIPYCKRLSPIAKKLGAVNTLVRDADGNLIGHNTDYFGFLSMVEHSGLSLTGKKVLVLGSGGASATVVAVLQELGAEAVIISRNGKDHYHNLHLHADAAAIVNATPVGMYPNNGEAPLSLDDFPKLEGVLDLIYNPARTALLMQAQQRGLVTMNGLWMLVAQAKESAEWFTGTKIPDDQIALIYHHLRRQMENIVLVGMPGCGKSTVGKQLALTTGRTFVDADEVIAEDAGMSIPEIFDREGEAGFRLRETKILSKLGMRSGLVIATGGGCVTRKENYPLLHQNGRIYWLQRDIAKLPTNGRPLSQASNLEQMYRVRQPLYAAFSDAIVNNGESVDETVNAIVKLEECL